jgi:GNAT superfamily N-acetyltransferase
MGLTLRAATAADRDMLARATLENLNWSGPRFTAADVAATPEFRHYVEPWPGAADFGIVAEDAAAPVGIVWLKHFTADDPGYGFVAADIPELSIWVAASRRGEGLGTTLLSAIIAEARTRALPAISLSVEPANPAARLYARHGFVPAAATDPSCRILTL